MQMEIDNAELEKDFNEIGHNDGKKNERKENWKLNLCGLFGFNEFSQWFVVQFFFRLLFPTLS